MTRLPHPTADTRPHPTADTRPNPTADTRPPPRDAETAWTATYRRFALLDEVLGTDCGLRVPAVTAHRGDEPPSWTV